MDAVDITWIIKMVRKVDKLEVLEREMCGTLSFSL